MLSPGPAAAFQFAELAPAARDLFAFASVCFFRLRPHGIGAPVQQFRIAGLPGLHAARMGLHDGHAHGLDVVHQTIAGRRAQGVQHHLRVALCFHGLAGAVLVINDVQHAAADHDAVRRAESLRHIFAEIHLLLGGYVRPRGECEESFVDEVHIFVRGGQHFGLEVRVCFQFVQGGGELSRPHCFKILLAQLQLRDGMGQPPGLGVLGAFIRHVLGQPCGRCAVQPPLRAGCGQQRVFLRCWHIAEPPRPSVRGRNQCTGRKGCRAAGHQI